MATFYAIEAKLNIDSAPFRPVGFIEGGRRAEFILKKLRLGFDFEFRSEEIDFSLWPFYQEEITKAREFDFGNDLQAAVAKVDELNNSLPIPHDQPASSDAQGKKPSGRIDIASFVDKRTMDSLTRHARERVDSKPKETPADTLAYTQPPDSAPPQVALDPLSHPEPWTIQKVELADPDTLAELQRIEQLGVNQQPAALAALRINMRQRRLEREGRGHRVEQPVPSPEAKPLVQEKRPVSADTQEKKSHRLPDNEEVRDLCHALGKNRDAIRHGRKTEIGVAREFVGNLPNSERRAHNLLRQARRFRDLWKGPG